MAYAKPSKSIRKYIRKQKARIRREILGVTEQNKAIKEIYKKLGTR